MRDGINSHDTAIYKVCKEAAVALEGLEQRLPHEPAAAPQGWCPAPFQCAPCNASRALSHSMHVCHRTLGMPQFPWPSACRAKCCGLKLGSDGGAPKAASPSWGVMRCRPACCKRAASPASDAAIPPPCHAPHCMLLAGRPCKKQLRLLIQATELAFRIIAAASLVPRMCMRQLCREPVL